MLAIEPGQRRRAVRRTDTTADEGEEEAGVARDLGRDLVLEEGRCYAEEDDVDADDGALATARD